MRLDPHLARRKANHRPLTPVDFLLRAVEAFPDRPAVAWHDRQWSYRAFGQMTARLARYLADDGIVAGDVVSIIAQNRPEMLAAHYAVPALGAVLNTINTRLDAETIAYILSHAESRVLIADPASAETAFAAGQMAGTRVVILSDTAVGGADRLDLLSEDGGDLSLDVDAVANAITDEWQPISLSYTSGTTGKPKGVVYHHRGAYLNALGNVMALGFSGRSVYLWTLPMFHCNGWCHTWAVTAAGGLHVCLDKPDPALIFPALESHGVTHFACAPVVLYMLLNHPARAGRSAAKRVMVATGGASPTSALIEQLDAIGVDLIHLYGLTESYGPATLCDLPDELLGAPAGEKAAYLARQGIRHATASHVRVVDEHGADVAADGSAIGEILLQGNTLMAGYYRDEAATATAFAGDWFHTGDLAVRHPDGAVEIKDRSKDIIISGGENISSLEIESVLHRHPAVLLAAVVAAPDEKWGEVPCAFIETKEGASVGADEIRAFCREHLAGFKVPKRFVFHALPKTATGKIQKFVLRDEAADTGREA